MGERDWVVRVGSLPAAGPQACLQQAKACSCGAMVGFEPFFCFFRPFCISLFRLHKNRRHVLEKEYNSPHTQTISAYIMPYLPYECNIFF